LFLFFSFSLSLPRLLSSSLTCSVSLSVAISRLFLGFIEPFYTRLPCLLLSLSLSQVRVFIQCLFCILHFSTFASALSRPIQVRCLVSLYHHLIIKISISSSYVLRYLFYFDVFVFYTIRIKR
jgi:hypothetical protein